jgi:hypothetical protein
LMLTALTSTGNTDVSNKVAKMTALIFVLIRFMVGSF